MAKKDEKHIIYWKKLFSVKGILAILGVSALLWYLGSLINIIPDTIPIVGYVDNIAITLFGLFLVNMILIWAYDAYKKYVLQK